MQKFVFMSKAVVGKDEIRQFVVLHAPSSFSNLIDTLGYYE